MNLISSSFHHLSNYVNNVYTTTKNFASDLEDSVKNPFGLRFRVVECNTYIKAGSLLNCLGYVDSLEKVTGITRVVFGLFGVVHYQSKAAALHVFRGFLEMMGNFEGVLLCLDILFTIRNLGQTVLSPLKDSKAN